MAKTLLETIKSQLTSQPAPEQETGLGMGQEAQRLLQAKSGRAVSDRGPKASSLLERQQVQLGQQAQAQQAQQGRLQAQQLEESAEDIAQRTRQQQQQTEQAFAGLQNRYEQQVTDMLDQFNRGQKTLSNQQDRADLEQAGVQLRLQNQQYIANLQDAGRRARLDNELAFKEQFAQEAFKEEQDLFADKQAFNRMIAANDREFNDMMASMDINHAIKIADAAAKAQSQRQMISGVGTLLGAGASAAASGKFGDLFGEVSGEANPTKAGGQP